MVADVHEDAMKKKARYELRSIGEQFEVWDTWQQRRCPDYRGEYDEMQAQRFVEKANERFEHFEQISKKT